MVGIVAQSGETPHQSGFTLVMLTWMLLGLIPGLVAQYRFIQFLKAIKDHEHIQLRYGDLEYSLFPYPEKPWDVYPLIFKRYEEPAYERPRQRLLSALLICVLWCVIGFPCFAVVAVLISQ